MPLLPGTRLGAYQIVAVIGAGGVGEVYRARGRGLAGTRDGSLAESVRQDLDGICVSPEQIEGKPLDSRRDRSESIQRRRTAIC